MAGQRRTPICSFPRFRAGARRPAANTIRVVRALSILTLLLFVWLPAACADEIIETYRARLSARDHFNTDGGRLTSPAEIIRQDRANVHRFGIVDPEDESDQFFASARNREILEKLLEGGHSKPAAYQAVVNGTPLVVVTVLRGNRGEYVTVSIIDD
jgi:hypothetical protein